MSFKTHLPIRQGDVLLKPISQLPNGKSKNRENAIVAYGEVTGHHHSIAKECRDMASVVEIDGSVYVDVFATLPITVGNDFVEVGQTVYRSGIDFSGQVTIDPGNYEGVAFIHQEHSPVVLSLNKYVYVPQREYHPESIRSIVD